MPELTLASYNCRWGLGRFGAARDRRFDVAEVVLGLEADVVVLAEAWRPHSPGGRDDTLGNLAALGLSVESLRFATLRLGSRPRRATPGDGWWELAVISRRPVLAREEIPLGRVWRDPTGPRYALGLVLDVDGVAVSLTALHVSSKLWYAGPVRHLTRLRAGLRPFGGPAVIAGDFNLWGPGVSLLLPGWRRTVRGRTYPSHRPHSQIDHVLVNDRVEYLGGEVLAENPSDHRPVKVRLRVGEGASESISQPHAKPPRPPGSA